MFIVPCSDVSTSSGLSNDDPAEVASIAVNGLLTHQVVNDALDEVGDRMTYAVVGGVSGGIVLVVIIALLVINVCRKKKDAQGEYL